MDIIASTFTIIKESITCFIIAFINSIIVIGVIIVVIIIKEIFAKH